MKSKKKSKEGLVAHNDVEDDLFVQKQRIDASDEDEEIDEDEHSRLLNAIASLDGKKRTNRNLRSEPAPNVTEFYGTGNNKVSIQDLVGSLGQTTNLSEVRKQLETVQKRTTVLPAPLAKHEQHKIQRIVAYEEQSKEITKWDPVIDKNRKAEQIYFPLQQPNLKLQTADQFVKRFQARTPLEMEVAALLQGCESTLSKGRVLTKAEERALRAMSLEEAKERRAELQKYRALMSYKEAKARRQKKIKSKKYHRIMRKEKLKHDKKEVEELQQTDPEAYINRLRQMDKARIQERMSLSHKGGSKFMKKQAIYGKHDDKSRQQVMDMLEKNKELTKKVILESDSEDYSDGDDVLEEIVADEVSGKVSNQADVLPSSNPWMKSSLKKAKYSRPKEVKNMVDDYETGEKNTQHSKQTDVNNQTSVNENQSGDNIDNDGIVISSDNNDKEARVKTNVLHKRVKEVSEGNIGSISEESSTNSGSESEEETELKQADNIDEIFGVMEKAKHKRIVEERKAVEAKKLQRAERLKIKQMEKQYGRRKGTSNKEIQKQSDSEESDSEDDVEESITNEKNDKELMSEKLSRKRTLDDLEADWSDDEEVKKSIAETTNHNRTFLANDKVVSSNKKESVSVDPKKFLTEGKNISHKTTSELITMADDNIDDTSRASEQRMTIAQAFADDDVINEFSEEKKLIADRDKPKAIDFTLPGWGEWGGTGVQPSKRKKKRFMLKPPPAHQRKDRDLSNVIISEVKDRTIAKHQVNELPFPFSNVKQFESSIRAPVGKTWNPETAYRQLIKPKVVTKLGTVIDPIDKSAMFQKQQMKKREAGNAFHKDVQKTNIGRGKMKNKSKKK